jgi:hypothetical protein
MGFFRAFTLWIPFLGIWEKNYGQQRKKIYEFETTFMYSADVGEALSDKN